MARYWTADLHLGDRWVAPKRGFTSPSDHDEVILSQLHELRPDDELYILGDLSSGVREEEQRALSLLRDSPPRIHLIAGNHDSVSSVHRQGWQHQRAWLDVFASVRDFARVRVHDRHVLMSHFPYDILGDERGDREPRYSAYRLPDVGYPLIHGHTHQRAPHAGEGEPYDRMFCVSWDAHRSIVTEDMLGGWIERLLRRGVPEVPDRVTNDSWIVDSGE